MQERHSKHPAGVDRRRRAPELAGRNQASAVRRAPAAFLWPCRATSAPTRRSSPRPTARARAENVQPWRAVLQSGPSLRRLILKPCGSPSRARLRRVASRALRASGRLLAGIHAAPIRGMAGSELCPRLGLGQALRIAFGCQCCYRPSVYDLSVPLPILLAAAAVVIVLMIIGSRRRRR